MATPDYFAVRKAYARALQGGAKRHSLNHCEWDISLNCTDPCHQDLHAYPPTLNGVNNVDRTTRTPLRVELWLRCRKCDACLKARSRMWAARAISETRQSIRTWFGTLTIAPEHQHAAYLTACQEYASSGDFDALDYRAQFTRRVRVLGREITRYVKRVRKTSKARLRILFVAEQHKSGLPHFHCLFHEHDLVGVNSEILRQQWKLGFTKWDLVDDVRQAAYVCKYLSKSGASRLRASIGYGNTSLDIERAFNALSCPNNPQKGTILPVSENARAIIGTDHAAMAT